MTAVKHPSRMVDYLLDREPREYTLPRMARVFGVRVAVVEAWAVALVRDGFIVARRDDETGDLFFRIANADDPCTPRLDARKE